ALEMQAQCLGQLRGGRKVNVAVLSVDGHAGIATGGLRSGKILSAGNLVDEFRVAHRRRHGRLLEAKRTLVNGAGSLNLGVYKSGLLRDTRTSFQPWDYFPPARGSHTYAYAQRHLGRTGCPRR